MKKISLLILTILMFSCAKHEGVKFINKDLSVIISLAQKQNKKIMLNFWSDG